MKTANQRTYISLFSGAGVSCYGFDMEGFACIATSERMERRLAVQRYNRKCKYESGYVPGDLSETAVRERLLGEIALWRDKERLKEVDVVLATPPLQSASTAGSARARGGLVMDTVRFVLEVKPKVFVLEGAPNLMRMLCADVDGTTSSLSDWLTRSLGEAYSIYAQVLNFKDYGVCSSRPRALVLAVRKDWADCFSPLELFPKYQPQSTLRACIGELPPLTQLGEIYPGDLYHSFRNYPKHMRAWLAGLSEGQSALESRDPAKAPHRMVKGDRVL